MTTAEGNADIVLGPLREELDNLDRRLLECLVERMSVCLKIAELKSRHGIAMMQPARVGVVLERAREHAAAHGLPPEYLGDILERVIAETCAQEEELMVRLANGGADT